MAGFEVAGAPLGQMVRDWRLGRFTPLYLAGIAAGAGIGLGLSLISGSGSTTSSRQFEIPPLPVIATPVASAPAVESSPSEASITIALPSLDTLNQAFAAAEAAILNPPPAAPAAPSATEAPAQPAAAPAPAAPPVQSVAQQPPAPAAPAAAPERPNFYLPTPPSGPATDLEQRLLDGINAERAKAGLPAYVLDAGLTKVARIRSKQLIDQGYFGHTDPYGYSMYVELLKYFGYSYAWAGENLAMNNTPVERSPQRAIEGLMNSPTHRANLLADDFFRIGIGEITTANGLHYYTMIFLG